VAYLGFQSPTSPVCVRTTSALSALSAGQFKKIARLVDRIGSEPRLVGRLGSGPRLVADRVDVLPANRVDWPCRPALHRPVGSVYPHPTAPMYLCGEGAGPPSQKRNHFCPQSDKFGCILTQFFGSLIHATT